MDNVIEYIIRGDYGEYKTYCCEDAEFFFDIMAEVTSAGISFLCRTPDGEEHILESTIKEGYYFGMSCENCNFIELCKKQANRSYDGTWDEREE